jgi:hypothetical protein
VGLFYLAQRFSPAMISTNKGAIVVTGNASALRGQPSFAGVVAPTKAAQPRRIGDGDDLRGAAVLFEGDAGKHITGPDPCRRRRSDVDPIAS